MEDFKTPARTAISILVDNHYGVLARISNMFNRRSFNIDSISASATMDPAITRITITVHEEPQALNQILLQTARLEEVRQVFVLDPARSLERELLLVKVAADSSNRTALHEISDIYKAKIIDLSPGSMVFELTGTPEKVDAFLAMFEGYSILELCRTGITAIERGPVQEHVKPE